MNPKHNEVAAIAVQKQGRQGHLTQPVEPGGQQPSLESERSSGNQQIGARKARRPQGRLVLQLACVGRNSVKARDQDQ